MSDFVAGDSNSKIEMTARDSETGVIIDLTGCTALIRFSLNSGTLISKTMTLLAPNTAGKAEYLFLTSELVEGEMLGEFRIVDGSTREITSISKFRRMIRARMA